MIQVALNRKYKMQKSTPLIQQITIMGKLVFTCITPMLQALDTCPLVFNYRAFYLLTFSGF